MKDASLLGMRGVEKKNPAMNQVPLINRGVLLEAFF